MSGVEDKNIMNSIHSIYNMSNRVKENLDDLSEVVQHSDKGMKNSKRLWCQISAYYQCLKLFQKLE